MARSPVAAQTAGLMGGALGMGFIANMLRLSSPPNPDYGWHMGCVKK